MFDCELWSDRLSDYLEGELGRAEHDALEQHLGECADCRSALEGLRAVLERTARLEDRLPERDLWPGILARLEGAPREVAERDVAPLPSHPVQGAKPATRRLSFSVPQLAAAALALSLLSGGMVWLLRPASEGQVAVTPPPPPSEPTAPGGATVHFAMDSARPQYDAAVADLERILEEGRGHLDPATIEALEQSLATIDRAIEEARLAVARDTADVYLNNYLADTMKRKLELLRYATTIVRAQS